MLLAMIPVGAMAGLLISAVITYVMPKMYESTAVIEITSRSKPSQNVSQGSTSPNHFGTEFEIIKSRNTLLRVVESLDLPSRWAIHPEGAIDILKTIVKTENIEGTDLCSIKVRHTNKLDARDIALEVVSAYKEYRTEIEEKHVEKVINGLKRAVREQEDKVEEARKILTTIARANLEAGSPDYDDAKRDFEMNLSLLEQMKLKLLSESIDQDIGETYVYIHDEPVISDAPVSPNVTMNLVTGLIGGALISPFLALPIMALMNRRKGKESRLEPTKESGF
jgi:uncharacterized protein involved in exopolysaccharide biosynthesis